MADPQGDPRRFTASDPRIEKIPEAGCWLWMGTLQSNGYGRVRAGTGVLLFAHRAFYVRARGPILEGFVLDHLCRTRACVNPDHLRVCTQRENNLAPGSCTAGARNAAKQACPRCGAAFTLNTYGRYCKPCRRRQTADSKRRRRAGIPSRWSEARQLARGSDNR